VSGEPSAGWREAALRDIRVIIDDDGYIELRFWASPDSSPSQITTTVTQAIGVITAQSGT
jgi:hypothetical protein